jgi:homoserine O-acetyltransferase
MNDKFGREERKEWLEAGDDFHEESRRLFRTYFEIESYLNYQGLKFVQRFDANSYLHITRAMDEYDLEKQFGSLEKAFADVKARVLVVALSGDWLFMPEQAEELASALIAQRKHVSYCCLEAPAGHDAFLTHITDLSLLIRAFLPWVSVTENIPRSVSAPDNRVNEYNAILEEVPEGCRVLDLGCGNGILLDVMKEQRNVQGMGVDISVHAVAQTLDHGHDVLLEDINDGLAIVPDDTFDVAILSETLQVMQQPRETIKDILRVAREATVVFPNFGSMNVRLKLLLRGRMPKNRQLPYEWYDTPNIHLFTLRDFLDLCKQDKIRVKKVRCFCDSIWSRLLVAIGLRNLGADRVLVHVERA